MMEIRDFKGLNLRMDETDQAPEYARELLNYDHTLVPGKLTIRHGYTRYLTDSFGYAQKGYEFLTSDNDRVYLMVSGDDLLAKVNTGDWTVQSLPEGCSIDADNVEFYTYKDRVYIISPGSVPMVFIHIEAEDLYNSYSTVDSWVLAKASMVITHQGIHLPKRVITNPDNSDQLIIATASSASSSQMSGGLEIRNKSDFTLVQRLGFEDETYSRWSMGRCDVATDGTYVYVLAYAQADTGSQRHMLLKYDPSTWEVLANYGHDLSEDLWDARSLAYYNSKVYVGFDDGIKVLNTTDLSVDTTYTAGPTYLKALAVDSNSGYLYAIEDHDSTRKLWRMSSDFAITSSVNLTYEAVSIGAASGNTYVYVVDADNKCIKAYKASDLSAVTDPVITQGNTYNTVVNPQGICWHADLGWLALDAYKITRWTQQLIGGYLFFHYVSRLDDVGSVQFVLTDTTTSSDENHLGDGQYFYAVSLVYDGQEEAMMSHPIYCSLIQRTGDTNTFTNHLRLMVKNEAQMQRVSAFHIWRAFSPSLSGPQPTSPFRFLRRISVTSAKWSTVDGNFIYDFTDYKPEDQMSTMTFEAMTGMSETLRGREVSIDTATVLDGQLFAGGIHYTDDNGEAVDLPQQVRWSPHGSMSQVPIGAENYTNIGDTSAGNIQAMQSVFNRTVAFTEHAVVFMYDGLIERTLTGYSLVDKNSLAKYDNSLFFATSDGIYILEGYNISKISDSLAENMQISRARGIAVPERQEYWVTINNYYTYIFHLPTRSWRRYSYTFESYYLNPDRQLIGLKPTALYQLNQGTTDDGADITAVYKTPKMVFALDAIKYLKRLIFRGTGALSLTVTCADKTDNYTATSISPHWIRHLRGFFSNWFQLRVSQTGPCSDLSGISLDINTTSRLEENA